MGQAQSSNNATGAEAPTKSEGDYYDLLGVDRDATEDELKKAYRRKALELHPDRNYGDVERTTALFAEIQSAYEVLSDPNERAWYDSHKDVLFNGNGNTQEEYSYNSRMTTAFEIQRLTLRFNGKLAFTDAPSGFYGGLNDFFRQLTKEEDIACQWENEAPLDYPEFGLKNDRYEDVVRPFYAAWTGFATRKSFAWKDVYRLSEAPDRIVRRQMEKHNKKVRNHATQEYNEAVRALVAFVRKRDPRVAKNQKSEAQRQKILREAAAAQAARAKAEKLEQIRNLDPAKVVPAWAQSRVKDEHEGGFSSESDLEDHEYECVVCEKTFKSDAQYLAHEKSKKHIKLLKQLKREMKDLDLDAKQIDVPTVQPEESHDEDSDYTSYVKRAAQNAKSEEHEHDIDSNDEDVDQSKSQKTAEPPKVDSEMSDDSNDEYASRQAIEDRLGTSTVTAVTNGLAGTSLDATPATSDTEGQVGRKFGKAKLKRARKAAQQKGGITETSSSGFRCTTCQAEFVSKTKLFDHLKEQPNHAAPVSQLKNSKGGKGKKR
jgi:DnaJ homolog subfamily A member 5